MKFRKGGPKKPQAGNLGSRKNKNRKLQENDREAKLAKRVGGRQQPNSGSIDGYKGDIVDSEYLYDSKSTVKKSLKITTDMIIKHSRDARQSGKTPAFILSFDLLPNTVDSEWLLIPLKK